MTTEQYIFLPYSAEEIVRTLGLPFEWHAGQRRWRGPCFVHKGTNPSLTMADGEDGKLGEVKCHSQGCDAKQIRAELARYLGVDPVANLRSEPHRGVQCGVCRSKWYWDKVWEYRTADGQQRCSMRYECRGADCQFKERKGSKFVHPDGESKHVRGGSPQDVLVRIVSDAPGSTIVLVEGEKPADAHLLTGYAFANWKGGAQSVRKADYAPLKGRNVILWPDDDTEGREAMDAAYEVSGYSWKSAKLVETTGETKRDAFDYSTAAVLEMLEGAQSVDAPVSPPVDGNSVEYGKALGLPEYLWYSKRVSQRLEAEVARVLHYMKDYILRLYTTESDTILVRQVDGLWSQLSDGSRASISTVLYLVDESREKAEREILDLLDDEGAAVLYLEEWKESLVKTPRHLQDVRALLIATIQTDVEFNAVEIGEMGNYHSTGIIPLMNGYAFSLDDGMVIEGGDEIGEKRLLDHGWAVREPDMSLTSNQHHPDAAFMRDIIQNHWGLGIIWDIAAAMVRTSKEIVLYRNATADSGKNTLMDAIRLAMGSSAVMLQANRSFSDHGRRFSQIEASLAKNMFVFINEIGTVTEISAGIVNLLDARRLTVEQKGKDAIHDLPRMGTLFLVGAAFPNIDMSHQGVPQRIGHCHDIVSDRALTPAEADRLLTKPAVEYLRALLFSVASDMRQNGFAWYESQPQWYVCQDVRARYIDENRDESVRALQDAFDFGAGDDWVADSVVKRALTEAGEDAPGGKKLLDLVRKAFPNAQSHRKSVGRGFKFIRPRFGRNDETAGPEENETQAEVESVTQGTL